MAEMIDMPAPPPEETAKRMQVATTAALLQELANPGASKENRTAQTLIREIFDAKVLRGYYEKAGRTLSDDDVMRLWEELDAVADKLLEHSKHDPGKVLSLEATMRAAHAVASVYAADVVEVFEQDDLHAELVRYAYTPQTKAEEELHWITGLERLGTSPVELAARRMATMRKLIRYWGDDALNRLDPSTRSQLIHG